jgi:quercetin dioxygenase-like cupin family protein
MILTSPGNACLRRPRHGTLRGDRGFPRIGRVPNADDNFQSDANEGDFLKVGSTTVKRPASSVSSIVDRQVETRRTVMEHDHYEPVFRSILPEDIEWRPFPAFPPEARLAVVIGQPSEPGPYVTRVKVPHGVKIMPHTHPEDRVYTVISGVFYIGLGERFDEDKLRAHPPGSVIVLPGGTSHFHWAKSGEYISQVTAIGPLGMEYINPADDPREHKAPKPN